MSLILTPADERAWRDRLVDPGKQWRNGYSAKSLYTAWHAANGFPADVARVLATEPRFATAQMLLGVPEHKVAMPGRGAASQTDLWVLARATDSLLSIAVEGKVNEDFGPTVRSWLTNASDGKLVRLEQLRTLLGLPTPVAGHLRYQLLHRAASAILEAQRFGAQSAMLMVHSFSAEDAHHDDYEAFAAALSAQGAGIGEVASGGSRGGVDVYLAWVNGS